MNKPKLSVLCTFELIRALRQPTCTVARFWLKPNLIFRLDRYCTDKDVEGLVGLLDNSQENGHLIYLEPSDVIMILANNKKAGLKSKWVVLADGSLDVAMLPPSHSKYRKVALRRRKAIASPRAGGVHE